MANPTLLFAALLSLVVLLCVTVVAWRLRHHAAVRADAERRAAVAYEEIGRLTRELRANPRSGPGAER